MPGILVVEDDENLNRGITFSLKDTSFQQNQQCWKKNWQVIIMDVTIGDVNLPMGMDRTCGM